MLTLAALGWLARGRAPMHGLPSPLQSLRSLHGFRVAPLRATFVPSPEAAMPEPASPHAEFLDRPGLPGAGKVRVGS